MKLLGGLLKRGEPKQEKPDRDSLELRVDFFGEDEVSVVLEVDVSEMECSEETAELRLFAWYMLRQFHNLGTNLVVQAFAGLLLWPGIVRELMKTEPSVPGGYLLLMLAQDRAFEQDKLGSRRARLSSVSMGSPVLDIIDEECLAEFPRVVEPFGRASKKSFAAKAPPFTLKVRGFGPLGRRLNYYAPHSVIALLRYLARKRADDDTYVEQLSLVAEACAKAYLRREIPRLRRPEMALRIVAEAQARSGES